VQEAKVPLVITLDHGHDAENAIVLDDDLGDLLPHLSWVAGRNVPMRAHTWTSTVLEHVLEMWERHELEDVQVIMDQHDAAHVFAHSYGTVINMETMHRLTPRQWLDEQILTVMLAWMCESTGQSYGGNNEIPFVSNLRGDKPTCWIANTFFMAKLLRNSNGAGNSNGEIGQYNFANVRRWTRDRNVGAIEKIVVPVNDSNAHWFVLCANTRRKLIRVYDGMGGDYPEDVDALKRWYHDATSQFGEAESASDWHVELVRCKRQTNGHDCGVFAVMFCLYLALDMEETLDFGTSDMPELRKWFARMIVDIGKVVDA
jgi:Ulp1 family protease